MDAPTTRVQGPAGSSSDFAHDGPAPLRPRVLLPLARRLCVAFGFVPFALLLAFLLACRDPDRTILATLSEPERAKFERGRQVALPCWTCHDLAGQVDKVGPSLLGVFGRRSGMAPDQAGSDAMRAASIVWDERSLGAFLVDPQGYVPGNQMVSPGVRDADALADLLFYLHRVTRPGARDGAPASP
jgi:cytochrome c